jgi:hypothetical protein
VYGIGKSIELQGSSFDVVLHTIVPLIGRKPDNLWQTRMAQIFSVGQAKDWPTACMKRRSSPSS